ncbi:hypothetical protein [uncultured Muribaculum sp.]|uniref:hypothetical protein n=1 Tax=uncultured Muribaculum sp. TaxID=1918613 RepID=UPI0025D2ECF4|nr:hypothetical protein [uncultured Muribaculum sp.]
MDKKYNFIYQDLVIDENDLIGLIAYGLYKKHKIEFIESFKAANAGQEPSVSDCMAFIHASCAPTQLKQYRDSAATLLQKMTMAAAREEIDRFEDAMLRDYRNDLREIVHDEQPKWWSSVIYSVIGAFVFSLIAALFVFLGSTSEKSISENVLEIIESLKEPSQTVVIAEDSIPVR